MRMHYLKCWPEHYAAMENGDKTFEIRKNDRDFEVGDTLLLYLFDPKFDDANKSPVNFVNEQGCLMFKVTYILENVPAFGLRDGFCIMQLEG